MAGANRSAGGGLPNVAQIELAKMGSPQYLGTITSGAGAKNNSDTAVPFTIPQGALLMLQADAAVFVQPVTTAAGAATVAQGVKLAADEKFLLWLGSSEAYVSAIALAGNPNIKVWHLG
jgi:hypothetical protein